ncbi:hypothetical protein F5148DRAFT_1240329 [Russula earlei]|uniref:Uncharacterized protein n=1 Tax=Russula earlei TaxID=71964 RepID=A0ACC0TWW2_9AGAM|nr:hypothetical protein F5148DRAFT_1240329 [Russula earlei]
MMPILEDALMRSVRQHSGTPPESALITSAMGLLAGLLSLPEYAPHIWLFARASTALFDSPCSRGAMAAERAAGTMQPRGHCSISFMRCGLKHPVLYLHHTMEKLA